MRNKTTPIERSEAWLSVISSAGTVATTARSEEEMNVPICHLQLLRQYLDKRRYNSWHRIPKHMPPPPPPTTTTTISSFNSANNNNNNNNRDSADSSRDPEAGDVILSHGPVPVAAMTMKTKQSFSSPLTNMNYNYNDKNKNKNPYAAIADYEDDDSDDNDDDDSEKHDEENNNNNNNNNNKNIMTMRRLYIRVLTTLSELYGRITQLRQQQRKHQYYWMDGANDYANAFHCLNLAVTIADEEYTRLFLDNNMNNTTSNTTTTDNTNNNDGTVEKTSTAINNNTTNDTTSNNASSSSSSSLFVLQQQLVDDAQVVMIALCHFAEQRDHYIQTVERRTKYLEKKLTPQWETRDEIKQRIGIERWNNNPKPKNDYAAMRRQDEEELRTLQETRNRLQTMETTDAYNKSKIIYEQAIAATITGGRNRNYATTIVNFNDKKRYNGIRPDYKHARISTQEYPDPTLYGWTFTGSVSESYVEFFEKEFPNNDNRKNNDSNDNSASSMILIKLDFYYTTGTVKTSMDHPTRGPNQLFGNQVTPSQYTQILLNPRAHTNVRYRNNNNKNSSNRSNNSNNENRRNKNENRGRRGGGGRGPSRGRGDGSFGRGGGK